MLVVGEVSGIVVEVCGCDCGDGCEAQFGFGDEDCVLSPCGGRVYNISGAIGMGEGCSRGRRSSERIRVRRKRRCIRGSISIWIFLNAKSVFYLFLCLDYDTQEQSYFYLIDLWARSMMLF